MKQAFVHSFNKIVYFGALALIAFPLAFTANGQCGFNSNALSSPELFTQKTVDTESKTFGDLKSSRFLSSQTAFDEDEDDSASIVGMWHIKFNITIPGVPDPIMIQEAFQIWNAGGTEVHNPNVDPRGGSVCLGAWKQVRGVYKLTHRVWSYATDGTFLGTINLKESVRVSKTGRNHSGTFSLDFFDPNGDPLPPGHVEGVAVGERISPN